MQKLDIGKYAGNVAKVNKSNGILASITTYNHTTLYGDRHYHDNAHFGFTIGGQLLEKKKEAFHVLPGKITYYYAGEPHQTLSIVKPSLRINLEIENNFFSRFGITEEMVHQAVDKNPDAKFLMIKIFRELLIGDALTDTTNEMLFLDLVHHSDTLHRNDKLPGWVRLLHDYLRENLTRKITLAELSLLTNVHPITISKHFPKYFHCTLGEYMRKLKVEQSLSLIKSDEMSLTSLAYECGFFDQSHFIRTFKEFAGYLPAHYKVIG